jgi:galactokinase
VFLVTQASPGRQATSLFRERFGSRPTALVSAPGRVNLLGEHTDYNGGPVLPVGLERRTVVAAGHGAGWEVVSTLDGVPRTIDPDRVERGSWTAYLVGAIRVLRREGIALAGARLAVASAVPVGAGLSSSAALTVALTGALCRLATTRLAPARLADLAYHAEHDEVGVGCGRMDQTVASLARPGHALLFETGNGAVTHLPFKGKIWLFETGITHRLTSGSLDQRRQECQVALQLCREAQVKVEALAELGVQDLPHLLRALPVPWSLRLRHVVTETERTRRAAGLLGVADRAALGQLLLQGHESLRQDYQSSCPEADLLVAAAVRHGAFGARLTGAGWGGAVLALLPPEREARIVAEVQEEFRVAFGRAPVVWATKASGGARSEKRER